MKAAAVVIVFGGLVEAAAACSQSTARLEGQGPSDIWIIGGAFVPQKLEIKQNETVLWTNKDNKTYTIVSDSGLFKQTLQPGGTFSFTFYEHNNHRYHNLSQQRMKGTVFVTANPEMNCDDCHG